jgi:hypothetical protein
MLQGKEAVLTWFDLNNAGNDKPYFKLYYATGKTNYIGEGLEGNSVKDTRDRLEAYLDNLSPGDYIIDMKADPKATKQFPSAKFCINKGAGAVAGIYGPQVSGNQIPAGYISKDDATRLIQEALSTYKQQEEIEALKEENAELRSENKKKTAGIGTLYEDNKEVLQPLVAVIAGKVMQSISGGAGMQYMGPNVAISGTQSAPVPPMQVVKDQEEDEEELTEEQGQRLDDAFFACVDANAGNTEETLQLMESLALWITANKTMFDTVMKPEILKCKKT